MLDTFRPSSIAAIFAVLMISSSRMTVSGFLPAGARGPLLLFWPSVALFLAILVTALIRLLSHDAACRTEVQRAPVIRLPYLTAHFCTVYKAHRCAYINAVSLIN